MYATLIRLMIFAALIQFGMSVSDLKSCRSRQCLRDFEKKSRRVLKIEWKPISVFQEEAQRFR